MPSNSNSDVGVVAEAVKPGPLGCAVRFPATNFLFLATLLIAAAWLVAAPLEDLLGPLRSEYRPIEMLSGVFLLVGFFAALDSAPTAGLHEQQRCAGAFALLFAGAYLGENNLLPGPAQPIVALPLMALLFRLLRGKGRSRVALLTAFALLGFGFAADIIDDINRHATVGEVVWSLPGWLCAFARGEELYEASSEALLLWAALEVTWERHGSLCSLRRFDFTGVLTGISLIAVGNGLLHAGYDPSDALRVAGFAVSVLGFVALVVFGQRYSARNSSKLGNLILYFVLVLLPTVQGRIPEYLWAAVWLPVFGVAIVRLLLSGRRRSLAG